MLLFPRWVLATAEMKLFLVPVCRWQSPATLGLALVIRVRRKRATPISADARRRVRRSLLRGQINSPGSPSRTDVLSCGRSPLFHRAAVCKVRYLIGPPSGFSPRVMGRGMQTNSVRIASADNRTFAYFGHSTAGGAPLLTSNQSNDPPNFSRERRRTRSKLYLARSSGSRRSVV